MLALIGGKAAAWFGGIWAKAALIGAILLGIGLLFLRIQHGGRMIERAEQREKINEAVQDLARREAGTRTLSDGDLRDSVRAQRDELRRLLRP